MTTSKLTPTQANAAKRLARLAAVQALYQIVLTERPVAQVIRDFRDHPAGLLQELGPLQVEVEPDFELFGTVTNGVMENLASIDEMIASTIDTKFSAERLEILLRAILRAGAFELHHNASVPAGVIINDYVDVAHSFFNAKEPGLVNAMLDKLAKTLRAA